MAAKWTRQLALTTLLTTLFGGGAGIAGAQSESAWSATAEQRLAGWQSMAKDQFARESKEGVPHSATLTISGREHPELLLQSQLFDYLIRGAFISSEEYQESFRRTVESRAVPLGFGTSMWEILGNSAKAFIANRRALTALIQQPAEDSPRMPSADFEDLASRECPLRWRALNSATKALGTDQMGRLLYVAVAPSFNISVQVDEIDTTEMARVEGGCQ